MNKDFRIVRIYPAETGRTYVQYQLPNGRIVEVKMQHAPSLEDLDKGATNARAALDAAPVDAPPPDVPIPGRV